MTKKDLLFDIIKDEVKLSVFLAALPANMLAKYAEYNKGVCVRKEADAEDVFRCIFPTVKKFYLDTICVYRDTSFPGRTAIEATIHLEKGGKMVDLCKIVDNEEILHFPDLFMEV